MRQGFADHYAPAPPPPAVFPPGTTLFGPDGKAFKLNRRLELPQDQVRKSNDKIVALWNYYDFTFYEPGTVKMVRPTGLRRLFGPRWVHDFDRATVSHRARATNLIPAAALTDVLGVYLAAGTAKTVWYCGLVNDAGFSAFASGDTAASHAGWTEWVTYSESVRQTWTPASPAGGSVTNSAAMVFTPTADATIRGAFLVSNSTKSGTGGLVYSEAAFDAGTQSLTNGTAFRLNATFTATSVT